MRTTKQIKVKSFLNPKYYIVGRLSRGLTNAAIYACCNIRGPVLPFILKSTNDRAQDI